LENDVKTLDGFLSALSKEVESAGGVASDATAFLAAAKSIERLLVEDWPEIEAELRGSKLKDEDRQRLRDIVDAISTLETKTKARLAWASDFEAHLRRALDGAS